MNFDYKYSDQNECLYLLHDCISDIVDYSEGVLSFEFDDGFWVLPNHPAEPYGETVRTGRSVVRYTLTNLDESYISIFLFTRNIFKKYTCREISLDKFLRIINSKNGSVEFFYQYIDGNTRLIDCRLKIKGKWKHCLINVSTENVTYLWNNLMKDRVW